MALKKLLYIANLRLPTEKAYGIQITKMCEALASATQHNANLRMYVPIRSKRIEDPRFLDKSDRFVEIGTNDANKIEVELVAPHRGNDIKDNLFDYYSIKRNFKFTRIWAPDFYPPKFLEQKFGWVYFLGKLDKLSVNIKNFISGLLLCFYALNHKVDVIYSRDEWPIYFLSFLRKNVIFEAHRFSERRTLFYERFKNKNIKLVVISEALKKDFLKFGFRRENILVAHDGVDMEKFNINDDKIKLREELFHHFHHDAFKRKRLAVYIGSLYSWKGIRIFSEVAKFLVKKDPNFIINIVIFGGNESDIKKWQEKLRDVLRDLNPNVFPLVYLGYVPHKMVPKILKAADCVILTGDESDIISAKYTSPLKMFEYMASGRPIVAQDLPSFREVLNENNAIFARPGNAEDLADKLLLAVNENNREEVNAKAQKALQDVQNYTWAKRASSILNFLD